MNKFSDVKLVIVW